MSLEMPSCQEEEDYIRDYYSHGQSYYENEDNYNDYDGCDSDGCDLH
jgi:hypothetical protein